MKYLGSTLFGKCATGDCRGCPGVDIDECSHEYVECSCDHHHAVENAAWDEERGSFPSMREQFRADVEAIFGGRIGT